MPFVTGCINEQMLGVAKEAEALVATEDKSVPPGCCMVFHNKRLVYAGPLGAGEWALSPGALVVLNPADLDHAAVYCDKRRH